MIFFLIVGILLGALSVIFVLQNVSVVAVTFLSWQFQGSLAVILFLAILAGAVIIALILLPSLIRDYLLLKHVQREKRALEAELADIKQRLIDAATPHTYTSETVVL